MAECDRSTPAAREHLLDRRFEYADTQGEGALSIVGFVYFVCQHLEDQLDAGALAAASKAASASAG